MQPFRFALVGTGNIAGTYARAAGNVPDVEVVASISRDAARASQFAKEHGIAAAADELSAVADEIDGVLLATPNGLHREGVLRAAELGKHVLCEKPLEISVQRIDEMAAACERAGVVLGTCYQRRSMPANLAVKRLLEEGQLGRVYGVDLQLKFFRPQEYYDSAAWRGTWELDGGGPFMQQGSHDIDLLCWMFGLPRSVQARTATLAHEIEVEDHGAAVLELAGGGVGTIIASTLARPGLDPRMDVYTEAGTFSMANDRVVFWGVEGVENPAEEVTSGGTAVAASAAVEDTSAHERMIADLAAAARLGREPVCPASQARFATALIRAVYAAARQGRPVCPDGA